MPNLSSDARKKLNQMLENDELTDILVKGEDSDNGHRVHAICIASVSSKFREKVTPGSHDGEVTFPIPDQVLKAIIGIAYHGRIEDNFLSGCLKMPFMFLSSLKLRNCRMRSKIISDENSLLKICFTSGIW